MDSEKVDGLEDYEIYNDGINDYDKGTLIHFSPCDYEGPKSSIREGRWLQLCVCYGRNDGQDDECNKKRVVRDAEKGHM